MPVTRTATANADLGSSIGDLRSIRPRAACATIARMTTSFTTPVPHRTLAHRLTVFAYGVVAYAVGVAALLALIVTMLGLVHFTGGTLGQLDIGRALALDALLLVAFAVQHSLMARPAFKAWWTRIIPAACERPTYVLATGLVLLPMLALWQPMPEVVWSVQAPDARWLLLAVGVMGWAYLFAASFAINHFELFGLQQVYHALRGRPMTTAPFQERWMYRFDRHPIMTGLLVGLWATPTMALDHLLFAAGTTVYVCIGVHFEERALRRAFGVQYDGYRGRVWSIVPTFTGRRSRPMSMGAEHLER